MCPSTSLISSTISLSGKEPFQPEAASRVQQLMHSNRRPTTLRKLPSLATADLYEAGTVLRQIFTDKRTLPNDPQWSWLGYSVGKWESHSLVVETSGFNGFG